MEPSGGESMQTGKQEDQLYNYAHVTSRSFVPQLLLAVRSFEEPSMIIKKYFSSMELSWYILTFRLKSLSTPPLLLFFECS